MPRWRSTRPADAPAAVHSDGCPPGGRHLTPYPGTGLSLAVVASLTIGQLADAAGVHVETVRYYERRGLLREPPRTPGGYRQYSSADLWRLQFIARAKLLGFTLAEVERLLGDHDRGGPGDAGDQGDEGNSGEPSDSVLRAARAKLRALDERQRELEATRVRLARLIDICEDPTNADCLALRVRG
jgi:DNA-binding transcriptional MerR regulator